MSRKLLKLAVGALAVGAVIKVGRYKFMDKKREYEDEEAESVNDAVRKYTAFFDRKLVEIAPGEFSGCELKAMKSKLILDLSRADITKDVYVSFTAKASTLTVILPSHVGASTDITEKFSKLSNRVGKKDGNSPVVYVIGRAIVSTIELVPENIYLENDEEEEENDMADILNESEVATSEGI